MAIPPQELVSCAIRFLVRDLCPSRLFWAEILAQIIEDRVAVAVRNDGTEPFHFFQLVRPPLARQVLFGDPARVVA